MQRGVSILPKQHLTIDKWVTFNNLPSNLNPLYSAIGVELDMHCDTNIIHILLETNIYPDLNAIENGAKVVSVSIAEYIDYNTKRSSNLIGVSNGKFETSNGNRFFFLL